MAVNLVAASGYESLRTTNLAKGIIYAGTIKARNWEDDFMPFIANTRVLDDLTKCGQVITFDKPPHTGAWREYEKNQTLIRDQVTAESFCLTICRSAYKSIKFDKEDIRAACDNWEDFESAFLEDAWNNLSDLWKRDLLTGMQLQISACNMGSKAGKYKNINMGTVGNPVELTDFTQTPVEKSKLHFSWLFDDHPMDADLRAGYLAAWNEIKTHILHREMLV